MQTTLKACQALLANLPPPVEGSWALEVDAFSSWEYHSTSFLVYHHQRCIQYYLVQVAILQALLKDAYNTHGPFGVRTNLHSGYIWTELADVAFCKDPQTSFPPFQKSLSPTIEVVQPLIPHLTPWPFEHNTFSIAKPFTRHQQLFLESHSPGLLNAIKTCGGMPLVFQKTPHGLFLFYEDQAKPIYFFETSV